MRQKIALPGGILIANPVPAKSEIPAGEMATYIEQATSEAAIESITGKAVTPWLLGADTETY